MINPIDLNKSIFNIIDNDIQKKSAETSGSSVDSIGIDMLPLSACKKEGGLAPYLSPPVMKKVDTNELRERLINELQSPGRDNNVNETSILYIILLMNKINSDSEFSKTVEQEKVNRAIYEAMINGFNDLKSYNDKIEFINKVLNIIKTIATSAGTILPLLYMGSPGVFFLLIEVADKIHEVMTGKSFLGDIKNEINDKIITPFLGKISDEIFKGLVSLGVNESQAKAIADELAKLILAGLLLSSLKFIKVETAFEKEILAQLTKLIEERLPFNKDTFNLISAEIVKGINTALPEDLRKLLQPLEKEIEAAFARFGGQFTSDLSRFCGSMIDIVSRFVSEHQLDAGAVEKALAVLESSLQTELGKLLHELFSAGKGNLLALEEKFVAEFVSGLGKKVTAALRAVLPEELHGRLQALEKEIEAAFARSGGQFATALSRFSGSMIDIVSRFVSEHQLDAGAVEKALAVLESSLQTELGKLLHELFSAGKGNLLALEEKFVAEFVSGLGKKVTAALRAVLPEELHGRLQALEKEIEAAFARSGGQFATALSRFSGSMIDIVSRFISEQQLDGGAVEKALAVLESSLQTELGKLLHELFSAGKGNLLALEEKFVAEFVSGLGKKVTAALRAVLPEELHGRLQALEKEIEAAFARSGGQFATALSRFSGSMIDIVSRFISEHQLDAGAVEKALAVLESSLQTELGKLLRELFSAAKGNLLALEEKFVAEFVSGLGKKVTAALRAVLPEELHGRLQDLEKEIEAAFARSGGQFATALSRFSGSMIDIVSRFISEQQLDAGAVEKALAALESSLQTEFGKLLHKLFSAVKGNLLALEEKFVAELASGFARRVTAALRAVLPEELHGKLQALEKEIEAAFARFANQYIAGYLNSDRNTANGAGVTFTEKYAVSAENDNDMAYQINQNLNAVHKTIYANVISDALASLNADTPVKTSIRARLIA